MYQVEYDGKVLKPVVEAKDAIYWAERLAKLTPRRSSHILPVPRDWLTENLPETNPPSNTRPGAEYGVDV
jgi:hypothetical protein